MTPTPQPRGALLPPPASSRARRRSPPPDLWFLSTGGFFFSSCFHPRGAKSGGETSRQLQLSAGLLPPRMPQPGGGCREDFGFSPSPSRKGRGSPIASCTLAPCGPYLSCTLRVWRAAFTAPAQTRGRRFVNPAGPQLENNCKIPHRLLPSSFPRLPRGPSRAVRRLLRGRGM